MGETILFHKDREREREMERENEERKRDDGGRILMVGNMEMMMRTVIHRREKRASICSNRCTIKKKYP